MSAHLHRRHTVRIAERPGGAREKRLVARMESLSVDRALQENGLFFEFSLCLSRACLGEKIVFNM
eukprot:COSAG06_NODE_84_length_25090_cov_20.561042_3_plen_65_part_00